MNRLLILCLATIACGSDDKPVEPPVDAPVDAPVDGPGAIVDAPPPLLCPQSYGPATIIQEFFIPRGTSAAFDLDGDGVPDNHLSSIEETINLLSASDIATGAFRVSLELQMLDDTDFVDDLDIVVGGYIAIDMDTPIDPYDDFTSFEPFYFSRDFVSNPDCVPFTLFSGDLTGGTITGSPDRLVIPFGSIESLTLERSRVDLRISPSGSGYAITFGRLGGVLSTCELSRVASPVGNSLLWSLVQLKKQPDIDMDEDGLESIETNGLGGIRGCTDGDGTVISSSDCACNSQISDGYSVVFIVRSVGARLLGPVPE